MADATNISPATLLRLAKIYYPPHTIDHLKPTCDACPQNRCNDTMKHMEMYRDKLHDETVMFVSKKMMIDHLVGFQSFAGARRILDLDICEGYSRLSKIHKSARNVQYIVKQDAFNFLFRMSMKKFENAGFGKIPATHIGLFLKIYEDQLGDSMEFIPWTLSSFLELDSYFLDMQDIFKKERQQRFRIRNLDDVMEKYKEILPGEWDSERYRHLENMIRVANRKKKNTNSKYLHMCWPIMQALKLVIQRNKFNMQNKDLPEADRSPTYFRVFVDEKSRYVMTEEFNEARTGIVTPRDPMDDWQTTPASIALRQLYEEKAHQVQIMFAGVALTKWRSVPIRSRDGSWCKLAIDVFFELLVDMIFGLKVFHRAQDERWQLVVDFVAKIEKYFICDKTEPYFITAPKIKEINDLAETHFAPLNDIPAPSLNIQEMDGKYTIPQILEMLNISSTFESISETARKIAIEMRNATNTIAAVDITDLVEEVVVVQFLTEFRQLQNFVHNQKGCHRLAISNCCDSANDGAVNKQRTADPKERHSSEEDPEEYMQELVKQRAERGGDSGDEVFEDETLDQW